MFKFLTTEGLIFLILGWGFVFGLLFSSLYNVFINDKKDKDTKKHNQLQ